MTNYTAHGSRITVGKAADSVVHSKLPANTYTVHFSDMMGFYLEQIGDFTLPDKIYGDAVKQAGRILETFHKRPGSTGVHLDGVKGSGKTLLVKAISQHGRELHNIPTIVINQPFHGDQFNAFIQSICTDAVIVFDEFEKTYTWQDQSKILTLFDGVYQSRKLFLLTTNRSSECSDYLKNRPGRMFYSLTYDVLDAATILEVLTDKLFDQSQIDSVVKYAQVFTFLNFDMLVAIIEEMNRYNETLEQVLVMLNVQPEMRQDDKFNIDIVVNDQSPYHYESTAGYDPNTWSEYIEGYHIIQAALPEAERGDNDDEDDNDDNNNRPSLDSATEQISNMLDTSIAGSTGISNSDCVRVRPQNLTAFDAGKGVFTYEVTVGRQKITILVTREKTDTTSGKIFNINAL
jgi:hypothetical protein